MELTRRKFMTYSAVAMAAPAVLRVSGARAQEATVLRLHHYLPPAANFPSLVLAPWAKKIEEESGQKLKVELFPALQLGGKLPQLYDQAKHGVVDIVWTLPGATPGRFPSIEPFELPFVAGAKGIQNALACQEFADKHLTKETADVKLLSCWAHDAGVIHTNAAISSMDDLKGLKLRSPTRLAGEALAALGATPVGMPLPQVPEALAQKAIDGCVIPWEVVPSLKIDQLTRIHTQIPGSPTLYTATFFLAMNLNRYNGLPDDLKAVIDNNSGKSFAALAGKMWDDVGADVLSKIQSDGSSQVATISEDEKKKWIDATKPAQDKWVEEMKAKGIDGAALVDEVRTLVATYANG